jgi:RNA polymerase sigma-70 factor (ECF subfamily)
MLEHQQKELLLQLKANEKNALKEIFDAYYNTVFHAVYRIVSDKNTAEDLSQDVFMRLWEKRHQITINGSIGAYIRRMAINEGLGYLRKHKKYGIEEIQDQHSPLTSSGEDAYMNGELKTQIQRAIETLPPRCKTVFVLSRFEELSYKEIGQKLDISPKTVENQISKALKILRTTLKGYLTLGVLLLLYG